MLWLYIYLIMASITKIRTSYAFYLCDSNIFCYGELYHRGTKALPTRKDFRDSSLKYPPDVVTQKFQLLLNQTEQNPTDEQVLQFVHKNFEPPESDQRRVVPKDWKYNPHRLSKINDSSFRSWAHDLNEYWKELLRETINETKEEPERYSLIWLPNPFIVPGGFFREAYYWDTYWIIKGILVCGMDETAKGIISNFLYLVDTLGLVPNGGRIYYSRRSQPPYLIPMMEAYLNATGDWEFLRDNIDTLVKEYMFWKTNRTVDVLMNGRTYRMYRYNVQVADPTLSEEKRLSMFEGLTVAESGWDISTRWLIKDGTNRGNYPADTKARSIIPVDLNSMLSYNARLLAIFYEKLNNRTKADEFNNDADILDEAINAVFWNNSNGIWFDYDNYNKKQRPYFYLSNFYPLWTGSYKSVKDPQTVKTRSVQYLRNSDAIKYSKGIPTSLYKSGMQWDFPNAWSPLHHMLIEALNKIDEHQLAFDIASRWINTNYKAFKKTGYMYEKYDILTGLSGHGVSYKFQVGFGWTNGVVLDLLDKYFDRLSFPDDSASLIATGSVITVAAIVILICILFKFRKKATPYKRVQTEEETEMMETQFISDEE